MYSTKRARSLWALVYQLEREAVESWREAHAKNETLTDALALLANVLVTKVRRERGGYVTVTVSIEANRPYVSDSFWFLLQKSGNNEYYVAQEDSPLDLD